MFTSSTWIAGAALGAVIGVAESVLLFMLARSRNTATGGAATVAKPGVPWLLIIGGPVIWAIAGAFIADRFFGGAA